MAAGLLQQDLYEKRPGLLHAEHSWFQHKTQLSLSAICMALLQKLRGKILHSQGGARRKKKHEKQPVEQTTYLEQIFTLQGRR